jgi:UDP-N-acetylglucosamine 1-carboxyvinyltransferase
VRGLNPACLELFCNKLRAMGVQVDEGDRAIRARARGALRPVDVSTLPHPGFATDLQAQFMVALSLAEGTSIVTENVFENRFAVVDELNRLGAGITTSGHHAVVTGPRQLTGSVVEAPDLRGGAALTIAGLVAEGLTEVRGLHHVDRGYEAFATKLVSLGADVVRVEGERRSGPATA